MTTKTETRSCPTCGKSIKADATFCIYCFAGSGSATALNVGSPAPAHARPETDVTDPPSGGEVSQPPTLQIRQRRSHADAVGRRYRDAYTVAASIIDHGRRLKTLALIAGIVAVLFSLLLAVSFQGTMAFGVLIAGVAVSVAFCGFLHAQGVRTCAEGQHLLASLDVAVNTSPFLDDQQKAQAMSL